jgi:hypothetical protein
MLVRRHPASARTTVVAISPYLFDRATFEDSLLQIHMVRRVPESSASTETHCRLLWKASLRGQLPISN